MPSGNRDYDFFVVDYTFTIIILPNRFNQYSPSAEAGLFLIKYCYLFKNRAEAGQDPLFHGLPVRAQNFIFYEKVIPTSWYLTTLVCLSRVMESKKSS